MSAFLLRLERFALFFRRLSPDDELELIVRLPFYRDLASSVPRNLPGSRIPGMYALFQRQTGRPRSLRFFFSRLPQLGNMISSAAAQIESTAGKTLRTELNGVSVPDYAAVQGIL